MIVITIKKEIMNSTESLISGLIPNLSSSNPIIVIKVIRSILRSNPFEIKKRKDINKLDNPPI